MHALSIQALGHTDSVVHQLNHWALIRTCELQYSNTHRIVNEGDKTLHGTYSIDRGLVMKALSSQHKINVKAYRKIVKYVLRFWNNQEQNCSSHTFAIWMRQ